MVSETNFTASTQADWENLYAERQHLATLMAHDLRSPIDMMFAVGDMLTDSPSDPGELAELGDQLKKAAMMQKELIQTYYDYLQLDHETFNNRSLHWLDFQNVLQECLSDYQSFSQAKSIDIKQTIRTTQALIQGHPVLLKRLVINLLLNAIKFSHRGSTIELTLEQAHEQFVFRVRDEGIGFPPEKTEELFEKFSPQRRKGTSGEHTSGLGLFVSRQIAHWHQGTLTAFSDGPEQGATFTLRMPSAEIKLDHKA